MTTADVLRLPAICTNIDLRPGADWHAEYTAAADGITTPTGTHTLCCLLNTLVRSITRAGDILVHL